MFLKYFHPDELLALLRHQRDALMFVQKVCRGFIARHRYRALRRQKKTQAEQVTALLTAAEVSVVMITLLVITRCL